MTLSPIYQQHVEQDKKDQFNKGVIDIVKSSFIPLVFTIIGGIVWYQNVPWSTDDR